ncbi:MAG: hypothetical protein JXR46_11205 [Calditrichaceae bacterium]|nr:hypothetical protein [Calditrichaceae bacterium]MBN2709601.1 hypothetical protein [Calditrichaceae bacterium]RQV92399.1 MAG: hypothetical protein EH224_15470 [Calditrichota bacterium]
MFIFNKDIFIPDIDLWLDSRRVRDYGFISHAHADHIANHRKIICSPPTADLLKFRLKKRNFLEVPFNDAIEYKNYKLTLLPAGHILGSAQILLENSETSLLYTGDFKLSVSRTAEKYKAVHADTLIMETTFGSEKYCLPHRKDSEAYLIELCKEKLRKGLTPVVFAYQLGKGQEALKILTDAGMEVSVDHQIMKYVSIYEKYGIQFGNFRVYKPSEPANCVILLSSGFRYRRKLKTDSVYTVFLSGWGMGHHAEKRYGVDEVIPISDHADYNELFKAVEMISPKKIYCTHGSAEFVYKLRAEGFAAYKLETMHQLELDLF